MSQRTSSYFSNITAISVLLLFLAILPAAAQQARPNPTPKRNQVKKEAPKEAVPLYWGTYVGLDLYGTGSKLLGGDALSTELQVAVNLKNKYIPTLEAGYGTTDTWGETGIRYKARAPFVRIGMDYNTMANKKEKNSYLYVGARYGFTSFTYDVENAPMVDPLWGDALIPPLKDGIWGGSINYDHTGMKATMHWMELVGGIKVQIYKNLHMGWSVRYKFKVAASTSESGNPWYVPGYGTYGSSAIGITYSIIYKLPL